MNNTPKDDNFNFAHIDKEENGLGERTLKEGMDLVSQYYNCKSIANAFVKRIREFK